MAKPRGSRTAAPSAPAANPTSTATNGTGPDNPTSPQAQPEPAAESQTDINEQALTDTFAALKTLLGTVEKLQKARQDVGDIKPLLVRLLDGEMVSGEELNQLKSGIGGLGKLVKFYGDYQVALDQAQPARDLLDEVLKHTS